MYISTIWKVHIYFEKSQFVTMEHPHLKCGVDGWCGQQLLWQYATGGGACCTGLLPYGY